MVRNLFKTSIGHLRITIIILATFIVFIALNYYFAASINKGSINENKVWASAEVVPAPMPVTNVVIGTTIIPVELATTTAAVQKGLSGRLSLDQESGMLFLFSLPDIYRFWMPDMHFPLDIVWINAGKVVDISADVSNNFDPAHPRFYTPQKPAQYVLEVNAGFAAQMGIKVGDPVSFKNLQL